MDTYSVQLAQQYTDVHNLETGCSYFVSCAALMGLILIIVSMFNKGKR